MDLEKFWLCEAMMIIMYLGIVITDSCRVIVQRTNNFFRTSNHLVDVARESRTIFLQRRACRWDLQHITPLGPARTCSCASRAPMFYARSALAPPIAMCRWMKGIAHEGRLWLDLDGFRGWLGVVR
jgi:hypothetical protein